MWEASPFFNVRAKKCYSFFCMTRPCLKNAFYLALESRQQDPNKCVSKAEHLFKFPGQN
jgi:hypothetical protein